MEGSYVQQLPALAQLHLILTVAVGHDEHAVDVVHIQQEAHAVLNHDAGCQQGLLLQRPQWRGFLLLLTACRLLHATSENEQIYADTDAQVMLVLSKDID